jgi:drug/metabolite transporter (DMT)-like permease
VRCIVATVRTEIAICRHLLPAAAIAPFGWVQSSPGSLVLFAASGVISLSALFCINRSLKVAPASVVVPLQYSMIVWAVMFGIITEPGLCGQVFGKRRI